MTCPTCRRTDVPGTCGSTLGELCKCCGLVIIATADEQEVNTDEDTNQEGREGPDSNNSSS